MVTTAILRALVRAGAVSGITIVAAPGGDFEVAAAVGTPLSEARSEPLAVARGGVRRFRSLDAAHQAVREVGWRGPVAVVEGQALA